MGEQDFASLDRVLLHWAACDPDRLAFADDRGRLTFGALAERAAARAAVLRRQGVSPGDRVALAMSAGLHFVEVFWALQLLGAAPCTFNPGVPSPTLARRIARVRPRLVLTDEDAAAMGLKGALVGGDGPGPEDLAFLQLTSGTSGEARASMILHRNVLAHLRCARGEQQLTPDDVMVGWPPPWHDLGLVRFVIAPVYRGAACHLVEPSIRTIPEWLRRISEVSGTHSVAPDFAFRLATRMVKPGAVDLASLRHMGIGAEPVRQSTIAEFEDRFGVPGVIQPGYGLGEATLEVTSHVAGEDRVIDRRGNVSCGVAPDGLELRAGISAEEPAEIVVRGEQVFAGYLDAPEETASTLRDGWLHTRDTGYLDDHGRLFVLGRREGMIKRAGATISPRELEDAALRVPGVSAAAAVGVVRDGDGDEVIVVAVQRGGGRRGPGSDEEIKSAVSREIVAALGFAPGEVQIVGKLPRTENGKVRHTAVRELVA